LQHTPHSVEREPPERQIATNSPPSHFKSIMQMPKVPRSKAEWEAVLTTSSPDGTKSSPWINKDLAPTPPDARTWSWCVPWFRTKDLYIWLMCRLQDLAQQLLVGCKPAFTYPRLLLYVANFLRPAVQNAFNASQWSNGASLIAVGLNWQQALVSCIIVSLQSRAATQERTAYVW
jgi:NCS1 family nucleobase:cation symporter-1